MLGIKNKRAFKRTGVFYVYILRCQDSTYYTGYTPNLSRRLSLHNEGKGARYTKQRLPARLVWCKEYKYFKPAFLEELRIKKLSRKQKEKLISEWGLKKQREKIAYEARSISAKR